MRKTGSVRRHGKDLPKRKQAISGRRHSSGPTGTYLLDFEGRLTKISSDIPSLSRG